MATKIGSVRFMVKRRKILVAFVEVGRGLKRSLLIIVLVVKIACLLVGAARSSVNGVYHVVYNVHVYFGSVVYFGMTVIKTDVGGMVEVVIVIGKGIIHPRRK